VAVAVALPGAPPPPPVAPPPPPVAPPPSPIAPPPSPSPPPIPPPAGGGRQPAPETFHPVRLRAKALVAAGRYEHACKVFEPLLSSLDPDVPAAARAEIDAIRKLESLDKEATALLAAVDAGKDSKRDDAVLALAAWWRSRLDERGLVP